MAVLSASALLLTACAPGNTAGSTSPKASSKALPTTAWEAAAAADVQVGGTLNLAINAMPSNWNIYEVDGNESDTVNTVAPTSGGPIRVAGDGTTLVDPNYATSVEVVSDDPQVIEIKLNPKAVWEDGTPITYKDYAATWAAMNGSNEAYSPASTAIFEQISAIESKGSDFDFTVTFDSINADWASIFTGVLPAAVASDPEAFNAGYVTTPVPSSGPFVISSIDTVGQVVTLTRNPKWWGEAAKLDTIVVKVVSGASQATSFGNSETDVLYISSNADAYQTAEKRKDAEIQASGGLTWTHVTMNGSKGPLKDVLVRQAIGHAVNRELISESANTPVGVDATTQGSYIFMPGQKGYEDNVGDAIGYDVDAAKKLLDEAGYKAGSDGTREKDGKALKLSITVPADTPTNKQRAVQVQADLKEVGVTVELNEVPAAKYFSDYIIPGDFEMTSFSWVGTPWPISSSEALFSPVDSESNFTGITDKKLSALFDEANTELDADKRIVIANKIDKVLAAYVPIIPIAPLPNVYAVKTGLVNYGATQFETVDWSIVGWKK
ncbi:ABC transporter family substrate-binding protein [Cryobacterium sp. TMT1-21]|uniref:ABC transporter family substrate-binding protein n=1 Tax=unclassified Cryobacterium TaxID=2649013 RepID=UPI00106B30CB|nr:MULTISPECIES: ABC transporter family substrate-binding protein [unclassified Cryobacterium]TFC85275.1 ABC transporter family substrate-binding protein [Cryobacterium sp. TmT2-59]TFD15799.1 ABC transporter family substrate-binding protein [Cryobacterium sp. TMT4-10]TFD17063.1 ABC transporter family substrate-binding protein [Cryobacterium sp. TMT1-21]TFD18237.1 ABC transporter family substrate-binding protein [Cryobacterium sp. TMT2-23]